MFWLRQYELKQIGQWHDRFQFQPDPPLVVPLLHGKNKINRVIRAKMYLQANVNDFIIAGENTIQGTTLESLG